MSTQPSNTQETQKKLGEECMISRRVLIVDDSRMQRKIVSNALKKWGYEIFEASGGEEALNICATRSIDLVISDWVMPGMNGLEFCHKFRALERSDYGYFILLTSKAEAAEIAVGLDAGADDFLTKPVSFGELRARLKAGERILKMQSELLVKNEIVSDTLDKLQILHKALDKDLQEARSLQQSLLKDTFVELDGATISLCLQSCGHIGGDLVGQFLIDETTVGLFSIDVSGHGVSSALMTARLSSYLSSSSPSQNIAIVETENGYIARDPAETTAELNNILLSELDTEHYFTMALAIVDLKTGHARCVQAGHPHPIVQKTNGDIKLLGDGGIPVGLIKDAEFESFDVKLDPGDRLLLYSDGITECENMGGQFLDEDGLIKILKGNTGTDGPEFVTDLIWELQSFRGDRDQADDISGLVFDFKGA
jgi:sigma-B regulation protein RsbU (phosphoserine phosphatase)